MKIDEDLWSQKQYGVLAEFVHHLTYYRVLSRFYNEIQNKSEFWTYTIDSHLLIAIIDWCMVFGTDSNEIHWKKVVLDEQYRRNFRSHLRKFANLSKNEMDKFWSSMTKFRNEYAVHKTAARHYPDVPYMDTALIIVTSYDDWFRLKVDASFEEPALRDRYERLLRTSERFFKQLIMNGPTINDEYEGRPPRNP
ncbi:MAG: hypothetical protein ABIL62_06460 [Planctomycetota bacterium]